MAEFRLRQRQYEDPENAPSWNNSIKDVVPTYGVRVRPNLNGEK